MIRNHINLNNKKRMFVAITAAALTVMLVASITTIGAAPISVQQQGREQAPGQTVTSSNIVDGEVRNQDLADNAVTSDKIANGEVKEEDLDPSIELGGGSTPSFSLQVTERSRDSLEISEDGIYELSVQCNSDEVVTGGGFEKDVFGHNRIADVDEQVLKSGKDGNGWTVRMFLQDTSVTFKVFAECLKVVNEGTAG